MLKVLLFVPKKGWLCKCDCGKDKYVEGNHLRNFKYLSCGCGARRVQAQKLRATLKKKAALKKAALKRVRHATQGSRCWVCRQRTGVDAEVALCKVCVRGCI